MSTIRITLKDYFVERVVAGLAVKLALQGALAAAVQFAHETDKRGAELTRLLGEMGFQDLGESESSPISKIQERAWALWMQPGKGGVRDVPHPACIEKHLPEGRPPTREELETAWQKCTAATSK